VDFKHGWCTRGLKSLDREDHRFILSSVLEDALRRKAMVDASMDPRSWGRKQLEDTDPDLQRALLQAVLEDLMGSEVEAVCNAPYGERSDERANSRKPSRQTSSR
jgi:hypothetical protein